MCIIDKDRNDILGIKFTDKISNFTFIVFSVYLPPENSAWGRDASNVFSHLISTIYLNEADCFVICSDLNARTGDLKDFVEGIDDIPTRDTIDNKINSHGRSLIEFLLDSKFCMLNGRLCEPVHTCISTKGLSTVDYMLVPHSCLGFCSNFHSECMSDIIDKYKLHGYLNRRSKKPDHSLLVMNFKPYCVKSCSVSEFCNTSVSEEIHANVPISKHRRYSLSDIPCDMFSSNMMKQSLLNIIESIERNRETQEEIDVIYKNTVEIIITEMNNKLPYIDPVSSSKKYYRAHKPFWNEDLNSKWRDTHKKEKLFRKCKGSRNRKNDLRNQYKAAQKVFDKAFRTEERNYNVSLMNDIETSCFNDPKSFWKHLKGLGPKIKKEIPIEIVKDDGSRSKQVPDVLEKWASDFESLYNCTTQNDTNSQDPRLTHKDLLENAMLDPLYECNHFLNCNLNIVEIQQAISKSKNGKAVGIDRIPNEILKLDSVIEVLHRLFQLVFDCGKIPSDWRNAIILPIPKDAKKDQRIPLHYRGISLLSCISKIYTSVLNKRIAEFSSMPDVDIMSDEQNGFRSKRSCNDHLYSVTSIIRNRMNCNLDTYASFIDLKKAFDYVDRDLLLYRLLLSGIDGNMYRSIQSIYSSTNNSVKVNQFQTRWFQSKTGVRQGDNLSPTLFNIFINDLISHVKATNVGIDIMGDLCNIFMYADDIVLLANCETDLQILLDCVNSWCSNWNLVINTSKSKTVHFRKKTKPLTKHKFALGEEIMEIVPKYKYLGIILEEHLDYNMTCDVLAQSSGRALGSVVSKLKVFDSMGVHTYSKLFQSGVVSVMDYAAEIWGFHDYDAPKKVTERAMRSFLGVHRFTPLPALYGDLGWIKPQYRRWIAMLRFWNRLMHMDNNRITKKIFLWEYDTGSNNWCSEMKHIFLQLGLTETFQNLVHCDLDYARNMLWEKFENEWQTEISSKSKLRTYKSYKGELRLEEYISINLSRTERSITAQFRSGILPLRIEVGRFRGESVEERLCTFCEQRVTEDEMHFLFDCTCYSHLRVQLNSILSENLVVSSSQEDKVKFLFTNKPRQLAKYLTSAFLHRRSILYK